MSDVIRATFTVGMLTLFSRIIGFIRECVMAFVLGAGIYTDAIIVALRLSNTLRRIFAEGAFNASFLPRFSKCYNEEGIESASILMSNIFSFLVLVLFILSSVVIVFFPEVLKIMVSGFDELSYKFHLTSNLGKICFPYLIFICITSLFCGVMNTINKFALPTAIYSILSLFTTIALLIGYFLNLTHEITVYIAAFFVLFAGIFQCIVLYIYIKQNNVHLKFSIAFFDSKVADILKNMLPGIIGAGVWQLNLLIDTTVSSYLPVGTITCINLADRLNQFPLGTLGIALSTALLPILSKHVIVNNYEEAQKELQRGILFAFFLTLYATAVFIALPVETVTVAFQRGAFGHDEVLITAHALIGFTIGLPAYVLSKIFSTVFFAAGDTKTPVYIGMCSVLINVLCLFILVPFLKYLGLALCTSFSAIFNAWCLIYFSKNKIKIRLSPKIYQKLFIQFIAFIITFAVLKFASHKLWFCGIGDQSIKWLIYLLLLFISIITYFICVVLFEKITGHTKWRLWTKEAWDMC